MLWQGKKCVAYLDCRLIYSLQVSTLSERHSRETVAYLDNGKSILDDEDRSHGWRDMGSFFKIVGD